MTAIRAMTVLCRTAAHLAELRRLHTQATALHDNIVRAREAAYADDLPVAVQVVIERAEDATADVAIALDILEREVAGLRRGTLNPVRGVAA